VHNHNRRRGRGAHGFKRQEKLPSQLPCISGWSENVILSDGLDNKTDLTNKIPRINHGNEYDWTVFVHTEDSEG
jgi:hypothetical protein